MSRCRLSWIAPDDENVIRWPIRTWRQAHPRKESGLRRSACALRYLRVPTAQMTMLVGYRPAHRLGREIDGHQKRDVGHRERVAHHVGRLGKKRVDVAEEVLHAQ